MPPARAHGPGIGKIGVCSALLDAPLNFHERDPRRALPVPLSIDLEAALPPQATGTLYNRVLADLYPGSPRDADLVDASRRSR